MRSPCDVIGYPRLPGSLVSPPLYPTPARNAVTRDRRVVIGLVSTRAVNLIAVERAATTNTKGSEILSTGRDGGRSGL